MRRWVSKTPESRDNNFELDVLTVAMNEIKITDSPWAIQSESFDRKHYYLNIIEEEVFTLGKDMIKFSEGTSQREVITATRMELLNKGGLHVRRKKTFLSELSNVGGLFTICLFTCRVMYQFLGEPFRQLNLGFKFAQMKAKINSQHASIEDQMHA